MTDIINQALPFVSALLQWARAQSKFREAYFLGIVVGAAAVFYLISDPQAFREPWPDIVAGWWTQVFMIMGTTQIVSSVSRVAVDSGVVGSTSPIAPVTNSR